MASKRRDDFNKQTIDILQNESPIVVPIQSVGRQQLDPILEKIRRQV